MSLINDRWFALKMNYYTTTTGPLVNVGLPSRWFISTQMVFPFPPGRSQLLLELHLQALIFSSLAGSRCPHSVLRHICSSVLQSTRHRVKTEWKIIEMNTHEGAVHAADLCMLVSHLLWPVEKWKPIFVLLSEEECKKEAESGSFHNFGVVEQIMFLFQSLMQTGRVRLKIQFSRIT